MKPSFFLPLLILIPYLVNAQLTDTFSDGDFTNNPTWMGNTDLFTVTTEELQLFNTAPESANTSYLYLEAPTSTDQATVWEFFVRQEFAPSTSNFARVYLSASNSDLTANLNGYFVQIGGITGSDDALELVRQDGSSTSVLISGTLGSVGGDPSQASVRVTRSTSGDWELWADYSGGTNYSLEGMATDATYASGTFFGVYCRYTSGRAEDFFFDNFSIDPLFEDTSPPTLLSVTALNATEVRLQFDESLDPASANTAGNYTINNGIGQASSATLENGTDVLLQFSNALVNLTEYELTASNIGDLNGNTAGAQSQTFTFIEIEEAAANDVIITEFMADQTPIVGLPEAEFIEIYNRSEKVLDLENWTISNGGTPRELPAHLLLPGDYLIIVDEDDEAAFAPFGTVVSIPVFPTITNSGDELSLVSAEGTLINEVIFELSWYQDANKDDGGWTLELIQLDGPYDCPNNWRASADASGGTPGAVNSLFGSNPDDTPPLLLRANVQNMTELVLEFSEKLDEASAINTGNYAINPALSINNVQLLDEAEGESVLITLDAPLTPGTLYTITVAADLQDCIGNPLSSDVDALFGIFEPALPNEVIITEFLADENPVVGLPAQEFIEIYNRSDRIIDLNGWTFANNDNGKKFPAHILLPDTYLIVTKLDSVGLFQDFGEVIGIASFPSISNDGSELKLLSADSTLIHQVNFELSWYQDNVKDDGGWTLELIQVDGPYDCPNNWRASVDPKGGTPGQPNSLLGATPDAEAPHLLDLTTESEFELLLQFSERLDLDGATDLNNYSITPALGIADIFLQEPGRTDLLLTLDSPLQGGILYTLTIESNLQDCIGNALAEKIEFTFGLVEPMEPKDLVINEILFNPETGGSRFVELYNRSDKVFNLNGLTITDKLKETGTKETSVGQNFFVFPGDYIAITPDTEYIDFRYQVLQPEKLVQNSLPSFGDKFGNVTISMDSITIDSFDYSEDLHFALLRDKNGVSLERLDVEAPTQSSGNWHSAAAAIGFATPTYENSQFTPIITEGSNIFSIPETTFSPDEDGFKDVLNINYTVDQNGYLANIQVFDANGRLIKKIAENELLASEGSFKWDGSTLETSKARIGIYVIWIELVHPDGKVEEVKETCVVAGNLD